MGDDDDREDFELPSATVERLAAPEWAHELTASAKRIGEAGDAMLEAARKMRDALE